MSLSSLRGWLVPAIFAISATLLTVPWSYWVIRSAYDRDIVENARSIAQRVELRVTLAPRNAVAQASDALGTEISTDPTVLTAFFYDLTSNMPLLPIGWTRQKDQAGLSFQMPITELKRRAFSDTLVEEKGDRYIISVPWKRGQYAVGVTYLELSRPALSAAFKQKEGPLLKRVVAISAVAILVFSVLTIYAYGTRLKITVVRERAEMQRQGLVAERGLTAAVLAHEIRNPLAALRFQLHSLRKSAADTTRVQATADTIDNELLRIQQLVTDYLEHEKARSMRVQAVNLEDSARGLAKLLDEMFRQTRTSLTVEAVDDPVNVTCDPHALRQVLINLALNAQQAMGEGGSVSFRVAREDGFGVIDVIDTGPGIAPEMRDRLFKPFQTSKTEGHGIGLALVKRFVDNFGGSVTVDSTPGNGSTFRLKLPLASDAPLPA